METIVTIVTASKRKRYLSTIIVTIVPYAREIIKPWAASLTLDTIFRLARAQGTMVTPPHGHCCRSGYRQAGPYLTMIHPRAREAINGKRHHSRHGLADFYLQGLWGGLDGRPGIQPQGRRLPSPRHARSSPVDNGGSAESCSTSPWVGL
jgi:hypothetical protein